MGFHDFDRLKREEQRCQWPPLVKLSAACAGLTLCPLLILLSSLTQGPKGQGQRPGKAHRFFVRFNFAARPAACLRLSFISRPAGQAISLRPPPLHHHHHHRMVCPSPLCLPCPLPAAAWLDSRETATATRAESDWLSLSCRGLSVDPSVDAEPSHAFMQFGTCDASRHRIPGKCVPFSSLVYCAASLLA